MRYILIIVTLILFTSCDESLIGDCPKPIKTIVNQPKGNTGTYTIDVHFNDSWWLSTITLDGEIIPLNTGENYVAPFVIDNEFFKIEKVNNRLLEVIPKPSEVSRKIVLSLQAGNCFETCVIEYKAFQNL